MSDEFTNVLVRMSLDLKGRLQREAFVNGRKLTGEINHRLEASLKAETAAPVSASTVPPSYTAPNTPTVVHITNDKGPASTLSGTDQAMLDVFRALPPEKQLALLSLFR